MIYDEVSKAPVEATIEIIDNSNSDNKFTISSNSESGNYLLSLPAGKNYGISVNAPGYLFHSENIYMPDTSDYTEIEKNIGLKKLEIGNTIVLNNIFYDFDKSTLRSESVNELEKLEALLTQNNTLTIELSSHTDGKGTDEYNLKLSQARAQSVVDYLKAKGIAESRLIPKGYGKSKPIASNDTEEGRQMNRRTEFKIISK
jgi:outer membrane protein OmpA-like peptidoglycan-associated protein